MRSTSQRRRRLAFARLLEVAGDETFLREALVHAGGWTSRPSPEQMCAFLRLNGPAWRRQVEHGEWPNRYSMGWESEETGVRDIAPLLDHLDSSWPQPNDLDTDSPPLNLSLSQQ